MWLDDKTILQASRETDKQGQNYTIIVNSQPPSV